MKRGFHFNLMVAGESGLGKSSLINSMFLADVCQKMVKLPFPSEPQVQASKNKGEVRSQKVSMEEGEVRLTLNVLDLPGFGDQIDNSRSVII